MDLVSFEKLCSDIRVYIQNKKRSKCIGSNKQELNSHDLGHLQKDI